MGAPAGDSQHTSPLVNTPHLHPSLLQHQVQVQIFTCASVQGQIEAKEQMLEDMAFQVQVQEHICLQRSEYWCSAIELLHVSDLDACGSSDVSDYSLTHVHIPIRWFKLETIVKVFVQVLHRDYPFLTDLTHRSWAHPMLYKKKQRFCYTGS